MNDNVEIIRSNKGGMKIIHRGYMYTVHKKRQGGGIRWRCTQRGLHCKGSISTGNGPPSVNMPHNHIPDPHSVALARCRQSEEFPDVVSSVLETEYDEVKSPTLLQPQTSFGNIVIPMPSSSSAQSPLLKSQPLSPTKLKVTRQTTCNNKNNNNAKSQTVTSKLATETQPSSDLLTTEEVCLRWNSHHSNIQTVFPQLLEKEQYVDVTVVAEGKTLKCHRIILSSCSSYFEEILNGITPLQHPVIILKGVSFWVLKLLMDFMYIGEVSIDQSKLPQLLDVADMLKVKGLAGKSCDSDTNETNDDPILKKENTKEPFFATVPTSMVNTNKCERPKFFVSNPHKVSQFNKQPNCNINQPPVTKTKEIKCSIKKIFTRKLRKRKSIEREKTPPLFPMRRGTRSRPNVKVPKYYDYEDIIKPPAVPEMRSFSPIVTIKTEPIDVEENDITFDENVSREDHQIQEIGGIGIETLESLQKVINVAPVVGNENQSLDGGEVPMEHFLVPCKVQITHVSKSTDNDSTIKTSDCNLNNDSSQNQTFKGPNDTKIKVKSEPNLQENDLITAVDVIMEESNAESSEHGEAPMVDEGGGGEMSKL